MATDIDFSVTVNPSADESGRHLVGSEVSGEVVFKGNKELASFKRITVFLVGKVEVYFFISDDSVTNRHFRDSDVFYQAQVTVWENSDGKNPLPMGESRFPFTFLLVSQAGKHLPATAECTEGKIRYTVEAKLIRDIETEIEAAVAFTRIPVGVILDINRTDLQVPRAVQSESVTCNYCCITSGSLSVIASMGRSGYCVGKDTINILVKVESENGSKLTSVSVDLMKRAACYAQGTPSIVTNPIATQVNNRLPRGGVSFSWNVPPIKVPLTDCSLTNCSIMHINYFIRVTITGRCISSQNMELPLILGNVSILDNLESLETTYGSHAGEYRPALTPSFHHYEPPAIPFSSLSQKKHAVDDDDDDDPYEEINQEKQLLQK